MEKLCEEIGFDVEFPVDDKGKRQRQSSWDMKIEGRTFEVKTASEDKGGAFQFNHIRYHRKYEALLCIGISPSDVLMGAWSKADVTTGKAGNLVSMERQANASFKLSKRPDQLYPIKRFKKQIRAVLKRLDA